MNVRTLADLNRGSALSNRLPRRLARLAGWTGILVLTLMFIFALLPCPGLNWFR